MTVLWKIGLVKHARTCELAAEARWLSAGGRNERHMIGAQRPALTFSFEHDRKGRKNGDDVNSVGSRGN